MAVIAAEGAADHDTVRAVPVGGVLRDKVPGGNEIRVLESVARSQDFDAVDLDFLSDAVGFGTNRAGAVGSMAKIVDIGALDETLNLVSAPFEFLT